MSPKKRGMHSRVCTVLCRPALYSPDIFGFVCLFQCSESEFILHCHLGVHQQARVWPSVCHSWPGEHTRVTFSLCPHFLPSVNLGAKVDDLSVPSSRKGL